MPEEIVKLIEALEDYGYTVLAYHRGRLKVAGILGWRDLTWADHIINREEQRIHSNVDRIFA